MAARCACGARKIADIHSVKNPDGHPYADPTRAGLKPISDGRLAYQQSSAHKEAYGVAEAYCVGHALDAPGKCHGPLTPHHTVKRSVGGLEFAEANGPVVSLCSTLNDAIESDPEVRTWALTHTFVRAGVSHPFLLSAKARA